jgi:hypothetical protein
LTTSPVPRAALDLVGAVIDLVITQEIAISR